MIAHLTIQPRETATTARSCEAAKIHSTWRTVCDLLSRPANHAMTATIAITTTVHLVRLDEKMTMIPSTAAIHAAMRIRRASSQRPDLLDSWSTVPGVSLNIVSTVPCRCGQPGSPDRLQGALRGLRSRPVVEQAVDRGARPADVRAERAERAELVGERRLRKVVRGQHREVPRPTYLRERVEERVAAVGPSLVSAACVERGVDIGGRLLARPVRKRKHDPV